ncbi:MAG: thermonuclease family protein [Candidatus Pacebacteria bacterium]|nr:thermonuclease family protein [Candidatus Paceibacterota bacterium]
MANFFEKNKVFLAIIMAALIVGAAIYFASENKIEKQSQPNDSSLATSSSECFAPEQALVTKIIDGDTIIVEGGFNVRLLGIDSDEKGYPCYGEASKRIEELILNKKVRLEKDITDVDQYQRCLRYVFLDNQNVGLELVKEGLAIARFYEPDVKYKEEIVAAERMAVDDKVGCKWSGAKPASQQQDSQAVFQWEKLTTQATGLRVVGACNAASEIGKEAIVEGKIADTNRSKTNTIFLNFEKPYPNHCFSSVIFSSDQYKFVQSPENYYYGKTVRIKGKIQEYQGKPEIILSDPSQIEIGK